MITPASREHFTLFKSWQLMRGLKKDGTYDAAIKLLGMSENNWFGRLFGMNRIVKTIGLKQTKFVVSFLTSTPQVKTQEEGIAAISKLEGVRDTLVARLPNKKPVVSKIEEMRTNILTNPLLTTYREEKKHELQDGLEAMGIVNASEQADKLILDDSSSLKWVENVLVHRAEEMGYTPSKGTRNIADIVKLFNSGLEDRCLALTLIKNQMAARNKQVEALGELFSRVPQEDLYRAVRQHYAPTTTNTKNLLELRIPIGTSGLHQVYFRNEMGVIEVALVFIKRDTPEGTFKMYRLGGTMAAIEDIACLDLKTVFVQPKDREAFQRELDLWKMQQDNHVRHIPLLYSANQAGTIFCENLSGGDVFDYVNGKLHTQAQRDEFCKRAGVVLLEYLTDIAALGLVHRDIKPENMLISKDASVIKVTDFGLSEKSGSVTTPAGTPNYAPPELFSGHNVRVDASHDIYSVGKTLTAIRYKQLDLPHSLWGRDPIDSLISRMVATNPHDRPTAQQALEEWNRIVNPGPRRGWGW
jgi:hypothetical protein